MVEVKCTWCNSEFFFKTGKRKTRQGIKQIYFCKACNSKFTDGIVTPYREPIPNEKMPRFTYQQNWEAYNKSQT